jgi:hypothetical protein
MVRNRTKLLLEWELRAGTYICPIGSSSRCKFVWQTKGRFEFGTKGRFEFGAKGGDLHGEDGVDVRVLRQYFVKLSKALAALDTMAKR